jgi:Putative prokaryotic signal transducing protein
MASKDARTVSVASCHSPAEAMMIRAVLSARGIDAIIPGANSASLATAAVGFSSRVLVDSEVAEEAAALIAELRSAAVVETEGAADGEEHEDDGDSGEHREAWAPGGELATSVRRRRLIASLCVSLVITFGAGHFLNRSWGRGLVLAGLEVLGFLYLFDGQRFGVLFIVSAMALDAIGSCILTGKQHPVTRRLPLPSAKLLPRPKP